MQIPRGPHINTGRVRTISAVLAQVDGAKNFLNVGFKNWNYGRSNEPGIFHNRWWVEICEENNIDWRCMEIFKPNVDQAVRESGLPSRFFVGDIMTTPIEPFDVISFYHGPEHCDKSDFIKRLTYLEDRARKLLIFGCPNGVEEQDPVYGNPDEEHRSHWHPEDWIQLGYQITVLNDGFGPSGGHIAAWKWTDKS